VSIELPSDLENEEPELPADEDLRSSDIFPRDFDERWGILGPLRAQALKP
jgi:hypothetical protein